MRLREEGEATEESGMAGQHLSLSQPSEKMDSLDEAGVGNTCGDHVGLVVPSNPGGLLGEKPELTSTRPEES